MESLALTTRRSDQTNPKHFAAQCMRLLLLCCRGVPSTRERIPGFGYAIHGRNLFLPCCRLVGTVGKGMRAWHVDTKRMVAHMRLEPMYPDVWDVACSPTEPTIACASSASQSQSKSSIQSPRSPHLPTKDCTAMQMPWMWPAV